MLNRKQAPENKPLKPIELLRPTYRQLEGGVHLYCIDGADADMIRIEFIFARQGWDPARPLTDMALAGLLLQGTASRTADEIAEAIDFYGAFLNAESGADHSMLTLHSLTRHLTHTLPVVKEVLSEAVFPEKELEIYRRNSRQRLQVNLEKNDFRARKAFNSAVFGSDSAYGYAAAPGDFDDIQRETLLAKYPQQFRSGNCTIVVSGKVGDDVLGLVEKLFGAGDWRGDAGAEVTNAPAGAAGVSAGGVESAETAKHPSSPGPSTAGAVSGSYHVEMKGSVQSAIRIGKLMVTRDHPDYPALQVLNTVLGGYFGSRLMANIREDKGYTYGIGSGLHSLKNGGIFFMATEVGVDVREKALREIYYELERLRQEPVPEGELQLVRNYMLGSFLGSLENVFSHADKLKTLLLAGLDYSYYDRYFETVRTVSAEHLQELAHAWFSDGFYEVTAG